MYGSTFSNDVENELKKIRLLEQQRRRVESEASNLQRSRLGSARYLSCLGIFLLTCIVGTKLSFKENINEATKFILQAAEDEVGNPNIIFILGDDMGIQDVGYSSEDLKGLTPNLDALAEKGIILNSYYTEQVCTPARAALLTGKYPIHTGMQHGSVGDREPWGLPLEHSLLPEYLKEYGNYKTHMAGKWHLGFFSPDYLPTSRGFDSQFGYLGGQESYFDHTSEVRGTEFYDWSFNGFPYPEAKGHYSTELITERAVEMIEEHAETSEEYQPLFLYLPYQAIHVPISEGIPNGYLHPDSPAALKIQNIPTEARRAVAAMMYALDTNIAKIVTALKKTGLYENSVIIFASDNGGCARGGASNWPFRGGKNSLWEGGLRAPAFVHSPRLSSEVQGTIYKGLFHVTDWFPTILNGILGQSNTMKMKKDDSSQFDGINLWNSLLGKSSASRETILHNLEEYTDDDGLDRWKAALRVGDYKMIVGESEQGWFSPEESHEDISCVAQFSEKTWYFNIKEDPTEKNNITDIATELLNEFLEQLDLYKATAHAPANKDPSKKSMGVWHKHDDCMVPWDV